MQYKFVQYIPDIMEEGVIYISMDFATAAHLCACGCGNEVITPFSPTDWNMTFNGEAVSLRPSIGNWSFDCRSHYWIKNNRVEWAGPWSEEEISDGRIADKYRKGNYYESKSATDIETPHTAVSAPENPLSVSELTLWQRIRKWFASWKN